MSSKRPVNLMEAFLSHQMQREYDRLSEEERKLVDDSRKEKDKLVKFQTEGKSPVNEMPARLNPSTRLVAGCVRSS